MTGEKPESHSERAGLDEEGAGPGGLGEGLVLERGFERLEPR